MTYEEIVNPKKFVRVNESTYSPDEEKKSMIGGEFEVKTECYDDNTLAIWGENHGSYYWFNRSDVQSLTPVEYNGRKIAIGDEVQDDMAWWKVCVYFWGNDGWRIIAIHTNTEFFGNDTYIMSESWIIGHRLPSTADTSTESKIQEAIKLLEDNGRIVKGKILK